MRHLSVPAAHIFSPAKLTAVFVFIICVLALQACNNETSDNPASEVAQQPAQQVAAVPASFADVKGGEHTYYENCAACHHHAGRVGPPLIFDAGFFVKAGVTPEQLGGLLFQPVRVKREGSIMPAFSPEDLSDEQVIELGIWLAGQFEAPAEPMTLGDSAHGAELYASNCALCHGANGEGGPATRPLAVLSNELRKHEMPETTIIGFTHLGARSGSIPDMPVWTEEELSDSDLADIAAFIWEFPPLPGMEGEGAGEVAAEAGTEQASEAPTA